MARIENVDIDGTTYDVGKIATTSSLGVVQVGSGLSITAGGVLSASGASADVYNIGISNWSNDRSFASDNWTLSDQNTFVQSRVSLNVTVTKDNVSVSTADLISAGNTLLNSIFAFDIPFAYWDNAQNSLVTGTASISATPTSITSASNALIIGGTYILDGSFLSGLPGSLMVPPLRFNLTVFTGADPARLVFHAETIYSLI